MAIQKRRSQMVMSSSDIANVYAKWNGGATMGTQRTWQQERDMREAAQARFAAKQAEETAHMQQMIEDGGDPMVPGYEYAPTETLEQIADRVAPNGSRAAQMKAAKAKAQQAVYAASRAPFAPNETDEEPPFSEQREA